MDIVTFSDVGQAALVLDQERHRMQYEASEARRAKAQASLREQYCLDRVQELEAALKKLFAGATYTIYRNGWREDGSN